MTTRENNLLLQFIEMVYPKDLLRYLELTGLREETVLEKDWFGVESGELILSTEGQEWDAINEENNQLRLTFFSWERHVRSRRRRPDCPRRRFWSCRKGHRATFPLERPHQKSIMVQIENAGEHFLQKGALFRRRWSFVWEYYDSAQTRQIHLRFLSSNKPISTSL